MHPRFHKHPVVPVAVPVATAQWELQMASGYSQGWSHVRDKRSHSCLEKVEAVLDSRVLEAGSGAGLDKRGAG